MHSMQASTAAPNPDCTLNPTITLVLNPRLHARYPSRKVHCSPVNSYGGVGVVSVGLKILGCGVAQVVGAVGWAGKRLEPPEGCPSIFADLMQQCFQEADRRPSFEKIIGELLRFANETRPQSAER